MAAITTRRGQHASRRSARRVRGQRGAALVELGIALPFLSVLVFGVIDLGRAWQLQNRLSNAAREGAAAVQFFPKSVAAGCREGHNATDRAVQEEPALKSADGYGVEVVLVGSPDEEVTGCDSSSVAIEPGDTLRVTVTAEHDIITPLIGGLTGDPIEISRSVDVVVQG